MNDSILNLKFEGQNNKYISDKLKDLQDALLLKYQKVLAEVNSKYTYKPVDKSNKHWGDVVRRLDYL